MSLQVEKLEKNMAKLTIEVPAEELEKALQKAYEKQRKNLNVPGFRKGKVPRQMIEKMYGPEIFFEEASNIILPEAYSKAYDEAGLDIVSQPEIDIVQMEKGKAFIFTALVATKPEVTLGEYKGLEVDKTSTRVTQKEIDARIQEEAEKNARTIVVERPVQDGDEVVLDFEGFVDGEAFEGGKGENYPLTIGSGSFIPGFEEQLIGAEAEKEVEVNVTFPEEYHAENLAGKPAVFTCTINGISVKELPALDDDFAKEITPDNHRLSFGVIDVGRDECSPGGYFIAHEFRGEESGHSSASLFSRVLVVQFRAPLETSGRESGESFQLAGAGHARA